MTRVVVLDYGSGNVRSAVRALERVGADVALTADPRAVDAADGLVVPGVGAFAAVMDQLRAVGGDALVERRLAAGRPVLGICVGMQVMFSTGQEHGTQTPGLARWPGDVVRLPAPVVPHMGWSPVRAPAGSVLFAGLADERFYFVHSYGVLTDPAGGAARAADGDRAPADGGREAGALADGDRAPADRAPADGGRPTEATAPLATWAEHGAPFVAAVEDGPLAATQFHPEKSGDAGAQLLHNWLTSL
ncbi:imidazole glycerol phosphate synthase subunit HisH [Georgenia sp. TF02-10]|uniref:imidazole glycerol phosphate synthase subunit HisH n=1 Tax=Georgenia sp. TF02-10 TaxID=2917725 RepID=UPI001FA7D5AD|nr:imidazole glycerol phosphate synthase subunit HisH [Georgenia sp. TF02-10]UNX56004.1 imidazole glycerol phosphate synthase subunit HisH [Georgenia sp. TF02-10]